jgi:hypothetical protein
MRDRCGRMINPVLWFPGGRGFTVRNSPNEWPRPWATGGAGDRINLMAPLRLGGMDRQTITQAHRTYDARRTIDSHCGFRVTICRVVPPPTKKIRPKKPTAAKLRSWRVSVLRRRAIPWRR